MQLMTELNEDVNVLITEATEKSPKSYYIESIFMQGDLVNRNRRNYPFPVLEAATNKYIKEKVETKRAMGELGHPEGPSINLDRVSHLIESLQAEGKNFTGRAKVMDTPYGKIVKNLMDENVKFGVSSRALGTVKANSKGINEVQSDLYIATAGDIVADPSAPDAFVNGIMENAQWVWESGILVQEDIENERKRVDEAHRSVNKEAKQKAILSAFENLILK